MVNCVKGSRQIIMCVPFLWSPYMKGKMQFSRPKYKHNILLVINYCMSLSIQASCGPSNGLQMLVTLQQTRKRFHCVLFKDVN